MRRALIIGAVVIVLTGIGGFVYWKYFTGGPGLAVTTPLSNTSLPAAGNASSTTGGELPAGQSIASSEGSLAVSHLTSRLTRISAGPVVPGEALVDISAASASSSPDIAVEFIERQSGNIFSYLAGAGRLTRTSNKTLPGIEAARWTPDGQTAFVTYLSDDLSSVNTYGLAADGSGGFFLPAGLADLAVSSTSVLALASGSSGSVASRTKPDGSGSVAVWSSPLSALRIGFGSAGGYLAFTKPSQSLSGYLFSVSPSGAFTRLVGPLTGLVALPSPSGKHALVSAATGGVMRLALVDTATGAQTALPVATVADKCAWAADDSAVYCAVPIAPSPDYSYPDDWYQGAVHFSDRIWKIDVVGRFAQLVFDPSTASSMGALDAEALALDADQQLLVFVNKNDGSLWSYQL